MAYYTLYGINRAPAATITCTVAAHASYPVVNVGDRQRQTYFQGGSAAVQSVRFDLGSAQTIGAIAFLNHNLGGLTATALVEYDDEATYTNATDVTPTNGWTNAHAFSYADDALLTFTPASARYWQVTLDSLSAVPKIGEIMLLGGAANEVMTFSASCPLWPVGQDYIRHVSQLRTAGGITHTTNRTPGSESGVGSVWRIPRRFRLNFSHVSAAAFGDIAYALDYLMYNSAVLGHPMMLTPDTWNGAIGAPAYHVNLPPGDLGFEHHASGSRYRFSLELETAL